MTSHPATARPLRFIMLGGFLGAGKTTAIARLARTYQDRGRRVAVITNDHASELVDTHRLRREGFNVGEFPGGCFCGSMDEFVAEVEKLGRHETPELVFVEPIGSCVDLTATVIRPLRDHHAGRFEIAPYGVLLKPSHGLRILRGVDAPTDDRRGFSPQAEYIFRKQLEEADFVVLNRVDQLPPQQVDELSSLLEKHHPYTPVVRASARTGQGFDSIVEMLDQQGEFGNRRLEVDAAVYAAGEADLGWLNSHYLLRAAAPFDLDALLLTLLDHVRHRLADAGAEPAHLKVVGLTADACGVANLISSVDPPDLSLRSHDRPTTAQLIVNARAAADPSLLATAVHDAVSRIAAADRIVADQRYFQSFRPGQPRAQVVGISFG